MRKYRFSGFEVDTQLCELRRNGYRVPLQPQPFQILCILLDAGGAVVSREVLIEALWQGRLIANADQSLNIAIRKLRDALDDSSAEPRFIQTIPRQGHRFAGDFEEIEMLPARQPDTSAYPSQEELPTVPVPEPADAPRGPYLRPRWLFLAVIALVILAGAFWFWRSQKLGLESQDLVLVARFDDSTGEKDFEGAYEAIFESELAANAPLVIVSTERIADSLRLMRQHYSGRPNFSIAMEVCRRDSGIRALVGGEVRRLDGGYLLAVRLVDPETGNTLASSYGQARTRTELVAVLRRLSAEVGARMGQDRPTGGPQRPLEKVTTASLRSARQYSQAQDLGLEGKWNTAEMVLREAVEQDPDFASGWILLAWAVRNQNPEKRDQYEPLLERALELAGRTSERERLFIRGSAHTMRMEYTKAVPFFENLMKIDPQNPWAAGQLSFAYFRSGQNAKVLELAKHLQKARPNDPRGFWLETDAAACSADSDTKSLLQAADRALALIEQTSNSPQSLSSARHRNLMQHAIAAWAEGNLARTKQLLDEGRGMLRGAPQGSRHIQLGTGYLTLGLRQEAEAMFRLEGNQLFLNNWIWWPGLFEGDVASIRQGLRKLQSVQPHPLQAFAALRAGELETAAQVLKREASQHITTTPAALEAAKGELEMRRGRAARAVQVLEPAVEDLFNRGLAESILSAQTLAKAYRIEGRLDQAIRVLERETGRPRGCGGFLRNAFWLPARAELMELYAANGQPAEADRIRVELSRLTALARPEYVVRKQLEAALRPAGR